MDERGGHSWGCMDATQVAHGLGRISTGLTVSAKMPQYFALHTRYGTTGARVVENSHPFTLHGSAGTVVGMHNGIISNHAILNRDQKRNLVVDSQHIFANIAEGRSLNNLEGYGTIVYRLNGEWFIGRFNDGDLRVCATAQGIFFASTTEALIEALSFAGIAVQQWLKVKDNMVYRLTLDGLHKAYKVDAMGTRFRWNDDLMPRNPYPVATATAAAVTAALAGTSSATAAKVPDVREELDDQCDWCGSYGVQLYQHGRREAVCADCYFEVSGEIPAGFDADTY